MDPAIKIALAFQFTLVDFMFVYLSAALMLMSLSGHFSRISERCIVASLYRVAVKFSTVSFSVACVLFDSKVRNLTLFYTAITSSLVSEKSEVFLKNLDSASIKMLSKYK